jgi:ELWxxDGT repeat protein
MELWSTDGTESGTSLVFDIDPGPPSGRPRELVRSGNRVFFNARHPISGVELWVSDGTANGTRQVKDINQQPPR